MKCIKCQEELLKVRSEDGYECLIPTESCLVTNVEHEINPHDNQVSVVFYFVCKKCENRDFYIMK